MTLREKIEQEIRERGPIPFSRYMELCLYDPEFGYYNRKAERFGKAGDFYTSSDVHAVFGRLLARQFEEMWRALGSPASVEVLELGPGRGLFAQDVLDWSEKKFPEFFQALHYSLSESSPSLRQKLQETLKRHFETGKASLAAVGETSVSALHQEISNTSAAEPRQSTCHRVTRGSETLDEEAPQGRKSETHFAATDENEGESAPNGYGDNPRDVTPRILFANEFFDAVPVEILSDQGSLRVSTKDGRFIETWIAPSEEELDFLDRYSVHPERGERLEAPLLAQHRMAQVAASLPHGFFVVIDYGYTRAEQLAGRHRGTLMTYRQHSASPNPYEAPGEQDITAHVNFSALAAAAEQNGAQVHPLLTQSQFLMGIGQNNQFADAFEDCRVPQERAKVALQLKHLVTPAGIGESFHVLIGSNGIAADRVAKLAGVCFGKSLL